MALLAHVASAEASYHDTFRMLHHSPVPRRHPRRLVRMMAHERIAEAERLRQVWRIAVPMSLPMKPWDLLSDSTRNRWLALADDSLRALPMLRRGVIYSPRIESTRVYVTVNRHEDAIVEVFIDVAHVEGSVRHEEGRMLAKMLSHALRAGASIDDMIGDMIGRIGGPEGDVYDMTGVIRATSLADLVAQVLTVAKDDHG